MGNYKYTKQVRIKNMYRKAAFIVLFSAALAGCKTIRHGIFKTETPHEEYTSKINGIGLDNHLLGQSWIQAAENAIMNPTRASIPFSEALVFDYDHLAAAAYSLFLREGQNLHVLAEPEQEDTSRIFIDLYRIDGTDLHQEAYAEKDSLRLDFRVRRDGEYIIRVQPELLTRGLFTMYLFSDASLNFPVPGKDFSSIASFFGDPRDGGRRRHEGVDIFAPRGTPALAVGPGRVTRTGTNRLGGKVVWVTDHERGYNYYYAHLDSQLVYPGKRVQAGDTLGLIGNTGNAITTPPHLHFGIYAFGRRSIDPYLFFHRTTMPVVDSMQIMQYAGKWGQTSAARTNFRKAPGMDAEIQSSLEGQVPLKVRGITGQWLRVELPEGQEGYVHQSLVKPAERPVQEIMPQAGQIIRSRPLAGSPAKRITGENERLNVYAEYNSYLLIGTENTFGWIEAGS
jgi:peptidoglycan LD-endopeptidase LytH